MYLLHLAAFFVFLFSHPKQQGLCMFFPKPGRLTAEQSLFYVGENITLHCHKDSPFSGEVTFRAGNDPAIDGQYVTRINNTDARLDKPVTPHDKNKVTYYCSDPQPVGETLVFTDYRPQNATHQEMIWYQKDPLIMNWKYGSDNVTYKNSPRVNLVSADWRAVLTNSFTAWRACDESTNTSCTVNKFNDPTAVISLRVNFTNKERRDSKVTVFPGLRVIDHVKPEPVDLRNVEALSSRSARLTVAADWRSLTYKISYCTVGDKKEECFVTETGQTDNKTLTVSDLHPHYTYTFRVQGRLGTGFFSDKSNSKDLTMPEDAPTATPNVTHGSFYLDRTECAQQGASATVYIYFQEVARQHQNGQIITYTAEVATEKERFNVTTTAPTERTLIAQNVDCQRGFNVSVYASTVVGRSPATFLPVPPWNPELYNRVKNLDLRLQVKNGDVTAEWSPDAGMAGSTLLLYFCSTDASDPKKCQTAIQDVEVNPLAGRLLLAAEANMMFGMAAMTPEGLTTGIVPTNCIYDPDKKFREAVTNVQARRFADRILVTWNRLERCNSERRVMVLSYDVELCTQQQDPVCQPYVVDSRNSAYNLTNVEAGTSYTVKVRAKTTSGPTQFSNATAEPLDQSSGGLTGGQVAGIVMGAITVCIILGCLIFCYCRDKIRRVRSPFSDKIKINSSFKPPVTPRPMGMNGVGGNSTLESHDYDDDSKSPVPLVKQQVSEDSGYDKDSPPLSPTSIGPEPALESSQPGADGQHSAPPTLGAVVLDPSIFTNHGLMPGAGPPQDPAIADNASEEEGGSLPPRMPAYSTITGLEVPLLPRGGGEQMVFFVTSDPPSVRSNDPIKAFPFSSGSESIAPLGRAEGEKTGGAGKGCEMKGGGAQKLKGGGTIEEVSSISNKEVGVGTPATSTAISSYVRLSAADHSQVDEEGDSLSAFGDVCEDDVLVEDHEEPSSPPSASESVKDVTEPSDNGGVEHSVQPSLVPDNHSDAVLLKLVSPLSPASENPVEEPGHCEEAKTRMNPAYVPVPQHAALNPATPDGTAQIPTDFTEGSPHQQPNMLHSAYVPHPVQSKQLPSALDMPRDHEEEEACPGSDSDEETTGQANGTQTTSGKGSGGSAAAALNSGYVLFSSVPGAALQPVHPDRSSPVIPSDTDVSDSESCPDIQPETDDSITEGWPTCVEDTPIENGIIDVEDVSDENGLTDYSNRTETNSDGTKDAEHCRLADKGLTGGFVIGSNGYIQFPKDSQQFVDTQNGRTEQDGVPSFSRLDSGYVSPPPDTGSTSPFHGGDRVRE